MRAFTLLVLLASVMLLAVPVFAQDDPLSSSSSTGGSAAQTVVAYYDVDYPTLNSATLSQFAAQAQQALTQIFPGATIGNVALEARSVIASATVSNYAGNAQHLVNDNLGYLPFLNGISAQATNPAIDSGSTSSSSSTGGSADQTVIVYYDVDFSTINSTIQAQFISQVSTAFQVIFPGATISNIALSAGSTIARATVSNYTGNAQDHLNNNLGNLPVLESISAQATNPDTGSGSTSSSSSTGSNGTTGDNGSTGNNGSSASTLPMGFAAVAVTIAALFW